MTTITHADGSVDYTHQYGTVQYRPPINGTYYHRETPQRVVDILERVRISGCRVRIHYGDTTTGRDWFDEWDVTGTIGRSMGPIRIPLIIANSRSYGGCGMLDHCIIRIRYTTGLRSNLYQHPLYHTGVISMRRCVDVEGYAFETLVDGKVHARFANENQANRWYRQFS
jgi:hypothetical protein